MENVELPQMIQETVSSLFESHSKPNSYYHTWMVLGYFCLFFMVLVCPLLKRKRMGQGSMNRYEWWICELPVLGGNVMISIIVNVISGIVNVIFFMFNEIWKYGFQWYNLVPLGLMLFLIFYSIFSIIQSLIEHTRVYIPYFLSLMWILFQSRKCCRCPLGPIEHPGPDGHGSHVGATSATG